MTNCEYCDYYRRVDSNSTEEANSGALCLFANVVLMDLKNSDIEYPCKDITYQQYLKRENPQVVVSKLNAEEWKFIYKSRVAKKVG